MSDAHRMHRRTVRSTDPSLSDEAKRRLTEELRDAVGRDEVEVPADRLDRAAGRSATHGRLATELASNRLYVGISLLAFVVLGGAIALATGSWWVLVGAVALHAAGTLVVASLALQLTTQTEHLSPSVAAQLEEEGVADPDRVLTELVEDYAGDGEARGVPEVVSGGANELTTRPEDDPGRATVEQRTAMTPTGRASVPAGEGSVIAAMPVAVVAATSLIALVVAIADGGWLWLAAVAVWGAAAAWFLLVRRIDGHAEERAGQRRRHDPALGPQRESGDVRTGFAARLAPVLLVVVAAVVAFMVAVALINDGL